ncbi:MAG: PEGA domain-containing protein, partial [Calditrichia bacterium]|nr:PEGA domain-containing protein [Calditrichia bacterium]
LKIDNKIINEHISNLPEEIQIVLRKLLQKSNDKRFKKASEILNFLPGTTLEPEVSIQKNEKTGKMKTNYWYILIPASIIIFSIIFSIKYINLKDNLSGKKQLAPDVKSSDTVTSKLPDDSTLTSGLNRKNKDNENIENKKTEKATTINNISDKNISENKTKEIKPGKLNIKCSPWANIYIDLKKIDTTPLDEPLSIPPGDYILQLLHPQYPEYAKKITITENKTFNIMVDFDTLYGYLDCKVYPWGEVFIDNKLIGQTPFKKPIILTPGSHLLTIINPQFKRYDKEITISRQKTVQLKINFEELEE